MKKENESISARQTLRAALIKKDKEMRQREKEKTTTQGTKKVIEKDRQAKTEDYKLWFYNKVFNMLNGRSLEKLILSFVTDFIIHKYSKLHPHCCNERPPQWLLLINSSRNIRQHSSTSFSTKQEAASCHPVSVTCGNDWADAASGTAVVVLNLLAK